MLDRKELRIPCGTVGLGREEDAGKLATTEDLGEKGIFRDASAKQLVGGRDNGWFVATSLDVIEGREDVRSVPGARKLGRLAVGFGGTARNIGMGRIGAAGMAVAVTVAICCGGWTDTAGGRARSRAWGCCSALPLLSTGITRLIVVCIVVAESGKLEEVKHGTACAASLFPRFLLGQLSCGSGLEPLLLLFKLFGGSMARCGRAISCRRRIGTACVWGCSRLGSGQPVSLRAAVRRRRGSWHLR